MATKIIHTVERPGGRKAVYRVDDTGAVTRTVEKAKPSKAKPETEQA